MVTGGRRLWRGGGAGARGIDGGLHSDRRGKRRCGRAFRQEIAGARAQSPVTIEHRGALYLTATGQLPRAPDCIDTEFCRCDVCARLKDLGYGSRAEYFDTVQRAEALQNSTSSVEARAQMRRERIKRRSQGAKTANITRQESPRASIGTSVSSKGKKEKPLFSPLSSSTASLKARAKERIETCTVFQATTSVLRGFRPQAAHFQKHWKSTSPP